MHASLLGAIVAVGSSGSGGSSSGGGGSIAPFFVLIALFALAYFIFLRPARNRQRAAAEARRQANVGDEIITTSGLVANVVEVNDDMLTLEIAPGVRCRYVPAAVLRVNSPEGDDGPTRDVSNHETIDPDDDKPDGTSG